MSSTRLNVDSALHARLERLAAVHDYTAGWLLRQAAAHGSIPAEVAPDGWARRPVLELLDEAEARLGW